MHAQQQHLGTANKAECGNTHTGYRAPDCTSTPSFSAFSRMWPAQSNIWVLEKSALPLFNQHMALCVLLKHKEKPQTHSIWFSTLNKWHRAFPQQVLSWLFLFLHFDFQKERLLDRKLFEEKRKKKRKSHKSSTTSLLGRASPSICCTCTELQKLPLQAILLTALTPQAAGWLSPTWKWEYQYFHCHLQLKTLAFPTHL